MCLFSLMVLIIQKLHMLEVTSHDFIALKELPSALLPKHNSKPTSCICDVLYSYRKVYCNSLYQAVSNDCPVVSTGKMM